MYAGEVLSFDWGTTVVGVLDVKTGVYTPYRGTHRIDGAQRIVGCRGRIVSFNGNSCDLPQIATIIGLASAAELKLQGTHDDMWEITGRILWPGSGLINGFGLAERYAHFFGKDAVFPPHPTLDDYLNDNWKDCYMTAQLWKKWTVGELQVVDNARRAP
jgi:hypothetical protein